MNLKHFLRALLAGMLCALLLVSCAKPDEPGSDGTGQTDVSASDSASLSDDTDTDLDTHDTSDTSSADTDTSSSTSTTDTDTSSSTSSTDTDTSSSTASTDTDTSSSKPPVSTGTSTDTNTSSSKPPVSTGTSTDTDTSSSKPTTDTDTNSDDPDVNVALPAGRLGGETVLTLKNLPINYAVQQIARVVIDGKEYVFTTQRYNDVTYLSRCEVSADGKTATRLDYAALTGYGHGESLDISVHNGQVYLFLGDDANPGVSNNWSRVIVRAKYANGSLTDVRKITGLECATADGSPIQADATPYRVTMALDDEADRIVFFTKADKNNTTKDIVNYLSVYSLSDIHAALDKSASVSLKDLASAYVAGTGIVKNKLICPTGSFQGMDVLPTGEILITGGATDNHPALSVLTVSGKKVALNANGVLNVDGKTVKLDGNGTVYVDWMISASLGIQDWSNTTKFVEIESIKLFNGRLYVCFNGGGNYRQNYTEIYRLRVS